jgi:formate hydrogenlyase subunit 3/multisubunit Na+/H+ antiporter MnhD subunit
MTETMLPLLVVIPLFGGASALFGKALKSEKLAYFTCVAAVASTAFTGVILILLGRTIFDGGVLTYFLGGWPEPYGISFVLDGFSWVSALLIVVISLPIGIAALSRRLYGPPFFFFLLLLEAGMLSVCLTGDLFTMFVSFEIIAIAAYVLIAYEKTPAGLVASIKYLFLSSIGILFYLIGVFLIYRDFGTLSISGISAVIRSDPTLGESSSIHLAIASLCVGIGVRTAFIPFHTWLPEAHAYAPHPISALLSGVLIKVSLFALVRILLRFQVIYLNGLLLWIGGVTALTAVILALAQSDAKRLLAYHSVSQMGYVLAAFAAAESLSMSASFSHALNHAMFKSLLFLSVGTAVQMSGERNLYLMKPVGRKAPLLSLVFLVGALSISGIPPFNGYVSKTLVLKSTAGSSAVAFLLKATSVATIASFIKLSRVFSLRKTSAAGGVISKPGVLTSISMVFLALLCVLSGLFAFPYVGMLHKLIGSGPTPALPALYTVPKMATTALTLALGVGLYFLVVSRSGKRVAAIVKGYAPDVRSVMLLFLLGLLVFSAVAFF